MPRIKVAKNTAKALQRYAYDQLVQQAPDLVQAIKDDLESGVSVGDVVRVTYKKTQNKYLRAQVEACASYIFMEMEGLN